MVHNHYVTTNNEEVSFDNHCSNSPFVNQSLVEMVLANVSAAITILLLFIVVITGGATGNVNLRRRSIATEEDELPFTTATLNDNDNDTNNTNKKNSPTIRKMSNNKIRSLHVSANHRRLVLDSSLVHDNEEGRDEETVSTVENERELAYYRYDGICEENGQFKLKFQVTVDSDLSSDETIEQLNTFYKEYVSEFNPDDYNSVEMIYYSSLQPTEEEGNFILWIDGDCSGNVDPAVFLSSVHEFLTADNNLRSTLGEVSVMNCKRFRNSFTCSTPVVPWVSDATTSTPVTSASSTTALASTSSTTVEPITTSSTTQVQAATSTQPPPISTTSSSTSNSITQAGSVQTAATPSPTVTPTLSTVTNEPTMNPSQSPITAEPTEPVLDCPGSLDKSKTIDSSATLYYAVVPSTNSFDNGIMCGRLEVANHDGWVSLGFSTSGTMKDSQAIVGIPDTGKVEKYDLAINQAYPMNEDKQTLRDTSININGGKTTMSFTKLLMEDGETTIKEEGDNTFLFAKGGATFGYHSSRSVFTLDLSSTPISSEPPTTRVPTYSPTEVRTYSPTYSPTQSFPTWSPTQMPVV